MPFKFPQRKLGEHRCPVLGKENSGRDELERKSKSRWFCFGDQRIRPFLVFTGPGRKGV